MRGTRPSRFRLRALSRALVICVLVSPGVAWAAQRPAKVSPTKPKLAVTAVVPKVATVAPSSVALQAGGGEVLVTLHGTGLDRISSCLLVRDGSTVPEAVARLGSPSANSREVWLQAGRTSPSGEVQLRLMAGTVSLDIPKSAVQITIGSAPAPAVKQTTAVSRRPTDAAVRQPTQPGVYVRIATIPGGRSARVTLGSTALPKASRVRAVSAGGGAAKGISVRVVAGASGQQVIEAIVRAEAVAGRYELEFLSNGRWAPIPDNALGLTVVDPKGGQTPMGALLAELSASAASRGAAGGVSLGGPGSAVDRQSLGQSYGLQGTGRPGTADLSRQSFKPDSRLMAEEESESAQEGGKQDGQDKTGKEVVTVVAQDESVEKSDGTATHTSTVTTMDSKGNFFSHTVTSTTDKDGNETTVQHAILVDANGKTTEEATCQGYDCTPDPERGGDCASRPCQEFKAFLALTRPLSGAMLDRFVGSEVSGLKGDQREPSSGGTSPDGLQKTVAGAPSKGDRDPNPEAGGSSSNAPTAPIKTAAPHVDVKKSLIDPQRQLPSGSPADSTKGPVGPPKSGSQGRSPAGR